MSYRATSPLQTQYGQTLTALSFDLQTDTLWTATAAGSVLALHTTQGIRGVTFPCGSNGVSSARHIDAVDSQIRVHADSGVGAWGKGGINKWYLRPSTLLAMSSSSTSSNTLAVSTTDAELLIVNSNGRTTRSMTTSSALAIIRTLPSLLVGAGIDGTVRTYDIRSSSAPSKDKHTVPAHSGGVSALTALGNYVYTIGYTFRQGRPYPDPLVKTYDLRHMLRALPPIPFSAGPAFLAAHPKRSSTIVVASVQGMVNIVDANNPTSSTEFHQLETSFLTSIAASPTGGYLAFGDTDGIVHLLSSVEEGTPLNGCHGQPYEWPDPVEPLSVTIHEDSPLNTVGMPHYSTLLLSSWTPAFMPQPLYVPPPNQIPPQILATMKVNDFVGYATMPKELKGRRNVFPDAPKQSTGRFRSDKSGYQESDTDRPMDAMDSLEVPHVYRKVEIEYSKFGVEDFDFGFYNKTDFSGLETHVVHSYTNSLLQALHYTHPIRQLAKSHITIACQKERCLFCELGFVFRMLEDAKGTNCHAANFGKTALYLKTVTNNMTAFDYGRDSSETDFAHMIQNFNHFLLDMLELDSNVYINHPIVAKRLRNISEVSVPENGLPAIVPGTNESHFAPILQVVGLQQQSAVKCQACGAVRYKMSFTKIVDMAYPRKGLLHEPTPSDFASILRASILRTVTLKATCQTCKSLRMFDSRTSVLSRDLPCVLTVNASIHNEDQHKFWLNSKNDTFLKPYISMSGQVNGVDISESVDYEIKALIVEVIVKDKSKHLVAIVKVPEAQNYENGGSPWYIFNDFTVQNISEREALGFPGLWKVPAILFLERTDTSDQLDFSRLPNSIDTSILSEDISISPMRDKSAITHKCLSRGEVPTPGTVVAIDSEFVSMQQEEVEYRSDGTKKLLRPTRMGLARVSVLRGDGHQREVPFIDDHIYTTEIIVDYLTEYSGIRNGDLDPVRSKHTLVPLKVAYKKLRLLVDLGCIFIGHGLAKDFRTINIFVPPEQVIDTVDLYFLPARQRRLSLRFLTWYVLKQSIQLETHDSIEDARSALLLYRKYNEFEEQGGFDEKLEEIYREGKQYNFKPPNAPQHVRSQTSSPALRGPHLAPQAQQMALPHFPQILQQVRPGNFSMSGANQMPHGNNISRQHPAFQPGSRLHGGSNHKNWRKR